MPAPQIMQREAPKPICASEDEAKKWAEEWYREYADAPIKRHDGALYTEADGLYELLEEGDGPAPVKLLRLSWLLSRAEERRKAKTDEERLALALPRRQELERGEPEAFLTPSEVRGLGRGHTGVAFESCCLSAERAMDRPLRVLSISHGWLTPEHPDPFGQQLVLFADQLAEERKFLKGDCEDQLAILFFSSDCCHAERCVPCNGQQCGLSAQQFPSGEFGVFYDYGSLMQKDAAGKRTEVEAAVFSAAIESMGVWYAHRLTTTFILSQLPPGWPRRADDAPFFTEEWLRGRGWPTFERSASNMIKPAWLNSWRRIIDPEVKVHRFTSGISQRSVYREPPLPPEEFAAKLARVAFTNGKSDCELVAGLYADTLAGAFSRARTLQYRWSKWGDVEAKALAAVLPLARSATMLDLGGNLGSRQGFAGLGKEGLDALAVSLRGHGAGRGAPALKTFIFDPTWGTNADELYAACKERGIFVQGNFQREGEGYCSCDVLGHGLFWGRG